MHQLDIATSSSPPSHTWNPNPNFSHHDHPLRQPPLSPEQSQQHRSPLSPTPQLHHLQPSAPSRKCSEPTNQIRNHHLLRAAMSENRTIFAQQPWITNQIFTHYHSSSPPLQHRQPPQTRTSATMEPALWQREHAPDSITSIAALHQKTRTSRDTYISSRRYNTVSQTPWTTHHLEQNQRLHETFPQPKCERNPSLER